VDVGNLVIAMADGDGARVAQAHTDRPRWGGWQDLQYTKTRILQTTLKRLNGDFSALAEKFRELGSLANRQDRDDK
jgi:hypothetical protein